MLRVESWSADISEAPSDFSGVSLFCPLSSYS